MKNRYREERLFRRKGHCVLIVFVLLIMNSCQGYDLDTEKPSWLGSSIYEYLNDAGCYSDYVRLIDDLGYDRVLSKTGSKTLFVADDDAFQRFYRNRTWGVGSYEELSLAQKKMLFSGVMINNAHQLATLSSTEGPTEGDCMRRITASSIYDSIPFISPEEMPDTKYWSWYKEKGGILCLKDNSTSPIIHFLEEQLEKSGITNSDFNFLFNNKKDRQSGDANINGIEVVDGNIKCLNGFVHKMSDVVLPLDNMAEIIRKNPVTSDYSKLVERFSAPYYCGKTMTDNFNFSFEQNIDSLYQKRYFSERSQNALPLNTSPDEKPVDATLKFDPGWNSFYSDLISTTTAEVALQQDMGVMIVPSNEALSRYWNDGAGKVLKEYYGTWENVPDLVVSKLINNNMLNSFVASVPSKFSTILDDASNPMNITEADIDTVFLGCNGAIYMSNKVFTPTSYASVSFPALINESMNIFYWAIEDLEYYAYLNSMDSYYSFIIPRNDALKNYVDPVSFGQSTTKIFKFYYDFEATSQNNKVKASIWSHNPETGMLDSLKMATYTEIRERLKDMLDYHIIIGDIESGNDYYMTKGGGTLKVENASMGEGNMKIYGGYQLEQGVPQIVSKIYDESLEGNGKTYIIEEEPLMTSRKTVYDILNGNPDFEAFFDLMLGTDFFETLHNKLYACGGQNIRLFNSYHYTVYVPTNESIYKLQDEGKLPRWSDVELTESRDVADSLTTVIEDFLRYHLQDNSIYIGADVVSGNYETAKVNPETKKFYRLNVNSNSSGITIEDHVGNIRYVTSGNNKNFMAREYQYNTPNAESASKVETSSYAVVHQIDGVLQYSATQFGE